MGCHPPPANHRSPGAGPCASSRPQSTHGSSWPSGDGQGQLGHQHGAGASRQGRLSRLQELCTPPITMLVWISSPDHHTSQFSRQIPVWMRPGFFVLGAGSHCVAQASFKLAATSHLSLLVGSAVLSRHAWLQEPVLLPPFRLFPFLPSFSPPGTHTRISQQPWPALPSGPRMLWA